MTKPPRGLARHPINTVNQVGEEIARIYRAMVKGTITHEAGTKLVFVLQARQNSIKVGELEERLAKVEELQNRGMA